MLKPRQFSKLQREWYAKLAGEGFEDIEWLENPNSPHLQRPASRGRQYDPNKAAYFSMCRNFLTHFRFRSLMQKKAWEMHTEGESYRAILMALKEFNCHKSIYWCFYFVDDIRKKAIKWNRKDPRGLWYAHEGEEKPEEPGWASNSLEVDAGFWESVPKPG